MAAGCGCFHAGKHILVAGAGVGGLTFAVSLHRLCAEQNIPHPPKVTLFERDHDSSERVGRGYSLSVRSDSGGLQVGTMGLVADRPAGVLLQEPNMLIYLPVLHAVPKCFQQSH